MSGALVLACLPEDYDAATGQCAAPFYTYPPSAFPVLTAEQGALIAFSIVGAWTLGVVARLLIRAANLPV